MKIQKFKCSSYSNAIIYPFKDNHASVSVYLTTFDYQKCKLVPDKKINWCAIGSQSVANTKKFIKALQKAVELCEAK
jgi:hypothetical protein